MASRDQREELPGYSCSHTGSEASRGKVTVAALEGTRGFSVPPMATITYLARGELRCPRPCVYRYISSISIRVATARVLKS